MELTPNYSPVTVYFYPVGGSADIFASADGDDVAGQMTTNVAGHIDMSRQVNNRWAVKMGDIEGWGVAGTFNILLADDKLVDYSIRVSIPYEDEALRAKVTDFIQMLRDAGKETEARAYLQGKGYSI